VTFEEIRNARIHEIYIIDVDWVKVQEIEPEVYLKRAIQRGIVYDYLTDETGKHKCRFTFTFCFAATEASTQATLRI